MLLAYSFSSNKFPSQKVDDFPLKGVDPPDKPDQERTGSGYSVQDLSKGTIHF